VPNIEALSSSLLVAKARCGRQMATRALRINVMLPVKVEVHIMEQYPIQPMWSVRANDVCLRRYANRSVFRNAAKLAEEKAEGCR
jgi:hypothetical protein